jgi:hypothetical protein
MHSSTVELSRSSCPLVLNLILLQLLVSDGHVKSGNRSVLVISRFGSIDTKIGR